MQARLTEHDARIVDLDRNADGTWNVVMYAADGVPWSWWTDETPAALRDKAAAAKQRIIDFVTYEEKDGRRLAAAVTLDNGSGDVPSPPAPTDDPDPFGPGPSPAPHVARESGDDGRGLPLVPLAIGAGVLVVLAAVVLKRVAGRAPQA